MATNPFETVNSQYGAPMGRADFGNITGAGYLVKARWVDGAYDHGGAYWGMPNEPGESIYAWVDNREPARHCHYVRATSRAHALEQLEILETKAVFRRWRDGEREVFALFPEINEGRNRCSSYQHLDQHSGADYHLCIQRSTPASPVEYAELQNELEELNYALIIIKRYQRHGTH